MQILIKTAVTAFDPFICKGIGVVTAVFRCNHGVYGQFAPVQCAEQSGTNPKGAFCTRGRGTWAFSVLVLLLQYPLNLRAVSRFACVYSIHICAHAGKGKHLRNQLGFQAFIRRIHGVTRLPVVLQNPGNHGYRGFARCFPKQ